jgi:hypothetical protein
MNTTITRGTRVIVTLRDDCTHERPHRPDEDGLRGLVTDDSRPGDHSLFVLYQGQGRPSRFPLPSPDRFGIDRLPLGRRYSLDEREVIAAPR